MESQQAVPRPSALARPACRLRQESQMAPKSKKAPAPQPILEYDFKKHELVIDCKGLCGMPVSEMNSGVRSLRALVMPKGKYAHVPSLAGRYFVLGEYRVQYALCNVHFKAEFKRDTELLTNFLDYGMADPSAHGVLIESYLLPLKVQHGVYQSQARYTPIEHVIGFSKLDPATESDLPAFLKRADEFVMNGIKDGDSMLSYVARPLAERLMALKDRAKAKIDSNHADTHKQGGEHEKTADDERNERAAKLDEIVEKIRTLPPENYDATLSTRVQCMDTLNPADHTELAVPEWIASPLRRELTVGCASGNATRLVDAELPWRKVPARGPISPVRRGRSAGEASAGGSGLVDDLDTDDEVEEAARARAEFDEIGQQPDNDDDDDDDGSDDDDDEVEAAANAAAAPAAAGSKRTRTQVQPYAPAGTVHAPAPKPKAKSAKQPKPAAKAGQGSGRAAAGGKVVAGAQPPKATKGQSATGEAATARFGISQVTGKPYVRPCGPYRPRLSKMIESATAAAKAEAVPRGLSVAELTAQVSKLREEKAELVTKLSFLTQGAESDVKLAMLQTRAEMAEKLLVQFQAGLEKGLAMASAISSGIRFSPPPSAGMAGPP